jgi:hypothetical protein
MRLFCIGQLNFRFFRSEGIKKMKNKPENYLEPTVRWMLERIVRDGGVSFPRTGETYPGFDVCKLCNFLVFRKPKEKKK